MKSEELDELERLEAAMLPHYWTEDVERFNTALRNAAPDLLLAARENAALRAENRSLVQTLCDEVNKATEELRARLEAAEKVVEAARGYIHAVMDNGNPASSPGATLRTLDTALSAYDRTAK